MNIFIAVTAFLKLWFMLTGLGSYPALAASAKIISCKLYESSAHFRSEQHIHYKNSKTAADLNQEHIACDP